jgi:hypothetical protein
MGKEAKPDAQQVAQVARAQGKVEASVHAHLPQH